MWLVEKWSADNIIFLFGLMMMHVLVIFVVLATPGVTSHGFLSSPRSRNLVAYEDRVYYPTTVDDPEPEDCPYCLNRLLQNEQGLGRCGLINNRDYDHPRNALGGPMKVNVQETYTVGSIIDMEVVLTAHHMGHFIFKACPMIEEASSKNVTQECFDEHPLLFVSDELYDAPIDTSHPERVYLAPSTVLTRVDSKRGGYEDAMLFQFKMKLPDGVVGDLVLIQWYYVASNSACYHDGYDEYPWPAFWSLTEGEDGAVTEMPSKITSDFMRNNPCEDILSADGNGIPEQFWNCAEVTIKKSSSPMTPHDESSSIIPFGQSLDEDSSKAQSSDDDDSYTTMTMSTVSLPSGPTSKTIIGYFPSWQWYDRQKLAAPMNFDFTKITRINFAFFQTNEEGKVWGTDTWADPNLLFGPYDWNPGENATNEYCSWDGPDLKNCQHHKYEEGLISLVHEAGKTIYPSLGGWSLSDPFPVMAANEVSRSNFVSNCIKLVLEYGFDGIDIDWEYPGYEDHSGTPEDTQSYNLLIRDLRMSLDELEQETGKKYGLTAAMPCGTSNIANIDIATIAQYLDEFNLMTYDFFGSWSPTTGSNAPVYDQDWGDEDVKHFSVDGCVRAFLNEGVSRSAINIGLPFYGRSFKDAKALNETHGGNDLDTWFVDDGSPQYFNIVNKLPNLTSVRHELTQTQFAYKETGGLVSYDDEQAICDKAEYCLEHDLNGFIIWEMTGDLMADLSTPLLDAVLNKLDNPRLDCESLAYDPTTINDYLLRVETNAYNPDPAATMPSQTSLDSDVQLTCPPDKTGPMQYDGCSGYYQCVFGVVTGGVIPCTSGSLFDEISMLCLPSETVPLCSGTKTSEPQTSTPSQRPQESPTLNPVFDANVVLNDYGLHTETPISSPFSAVLAPFATTPEQNSIDVISQNIECPDEFTGLVAWNQCSIYFYCLMGVPYPPIMQCETGKLFDIELKSCLDSSQVTCLPSTEDKNLMNANSYSPEANSFSSSVHMGISNIMATNIQVETSTEKPRTGLIVGIMILSCGSLVFILFVLAKRRQNCSSTESFGEV